MLLQTSNDFLVVADRYFQLQVMREPEVDTYVGKSIDHHGTADLPRRLGWEDSHPWLPFAHM